ncbi:DUF1854 domain-containing protein [candidate division KSB1 bacterium]|nr:DUF1854 domain-containing protein [candidate division KSB1 bacterium]
MTTIDLQNHDSMIFSANEQRWELYRNSEGRLILRKLEADNSTQETPIQVAACFPWSHPQQFVSLRDDKGHELLLLESLQELTGGPRQLLEEELALRNFLPRVLEIQNISDQMEFFHWEVQTTAGPRSFLTRRHERPRQLSDGQMLIKDICNDIYVVSRSEEMDPKSLRLLWVYLD